MIRPPPQHTQHTPPGHQIEMSYSTQEGAREGRRGREGGREGWGREGDVSGVKERKEGVGEVRDINGTKR